MSLSDEQERREALAEVVNTDDSDGDLANYEESQLNDRMGHVGPTPGPWIVDESTTPNGVGYFINHLWDGDVDGDGESTHTDEVAEVQMDYRGDRALANARLLAAAPDLLAAIKSLATAVSSINALSGPLGKEILSSAYVAIAKAERGE